VNTRIKTMMMKSAGKQRNAAPEYMILGPPTEANRRIPNTARSTRTRTTPMIAV
jgi:hypothetical protein